MDQINTPDTSAPIVCNMTDAPDTLPDRMAEYEELFRLHLIDRERDGNVARFRFRNADGVEDRLRAVSVLEHDCCRFFGFSVRAVGHEVWWEVSITDSEAAGPILDEFYALPETIGQDVAFVHERFTESGLRVVIQDETSLRPAGLDDMVPKL